MSVKPIPTGYETVIPYLIVNDAAKAIEFYKQAFGATELMRLASPDGRVGHAELTIGPTHIMLADEFPEMGHRSPQSLGGSPVNLLMYVKDVDARFQQALAAGAKVTRPLADQFYGDRLGVLTDPFGHMWSLASRKEDLTAAEIQDRSDKFMQKSSKS